MDDVSVKITRVIIWGIVVFLISAIIEAMITMFMFKKFGGCLMQDKRR